MTNTIIILFTVLIFCSCSSDKDVKQEAEKIAIAAHQLQKTKLIDELVLKYNIRYQLDTLDFQFSQDYKPVIMSQYQLIDYFEIADIYEKDSIEYVQIRIDNDPIIYLNFPVSQQQVEILRSGEDASLPFDLIMHQHDESQLKTTKKDNILVVSISEISKISQIYGENTRDVNSVNTEAFTGKGQIVDIVTISK